MTGAFEKKAEGSQNYLAALCFLTVLATTAGILLVRSHYKLFWIDELLEHYTDSKPSVAAIISGQLHSPFSLEPPVSHILLHFAWRLIPSAPLALRLPSMLALLVTEVCAFFLAARISKSLAAAFIAMLFPLYLVSVTYGPEARVYSLLTASMASSLLAWSVAASRAQSRAIPLLWLAMSLGASMLLHYYGTLLALPLFAGETVRCWQRRNVDWPVALAIVSGSSLFLLDLPFFHALGPIRKHYYNPDAHTWTIVPFTYSWFFNHFRAYNFYPLKASASEAACVALVMLAIAASVWRIKSGWRSATSQVGLEAALCATALLPWMNLAVAQFSRAYVPRYSLPAIVGISVLIALMLHSLKAIRTVLPGVAVLLFLAGVYNCRAEISQDKHGGMTNLAHLNLTPSQQEAAARVADRTIYVQDDETFLFLNYYSPTVSGHPIKGVFSQSCEMRWNERDAESIFSREMQDTTPVPFVDYKFLSQPGSTHLFLLMKDPVQEWIDKDFKAEGADVESLGRALGGDLLKVTFRSASRCV